MANIRDIGGEDIVARTASELLVSCLGRNLTSGSIDLYTILVTTKDPITGLNLDNFISGNFDVSYVKASNGTNVGNNLLDEVDPEGTIDITFKDDYNFISSNSYGFCRNKLLGMLRGETFTIGSDTIEVVGTNGNIKTDTVKIPVANLNLPFKDLLYYEGNNLKISQGVLNGQPTFRINSFINNYNRTRKCVALEFYTASGSGKQSSYLFPYVAVNTVTHDEGDENMYSVSAIRICDAWERENYFSSGVSSEDELTTDNIREIEVDYIVEATSEPTDFGESGDVICKINPTTGVFEIKVSDGSAWQDPASAGTFIAQARIFSKNHTTDTIANATQRNCFVSTATAVSDMSNGQGTAYYTGSTPSYICNVYNYNRDTQAFEYYSSVV